MPSRTTRIATIILTLMLLPAVATAQERTPTVQVGDHVRLYSPSGDVLRAEGRVERLAPGRIFLRQEGAAATVSDTLEWNDLLAVRRRVPTGESVRHRATWGGFLGASIGGIAAPFIMRSEGSPSPAGRAALGVGAGALVGVGVGALVGYLLPRHRWDFIRVEYGLSGIPPLGS